MNSIHISKEHWSPVTKGDFEKVLNRLDPLSGYSGNCTRYLRSKIRNILTGENIGWAYNKNGDQDLKTVHMMMQAVADGQLPAAGHGTTLISVGPPLTVEELRQVISEIEETRIKLTRYYLALGLRRGALTKGDVLTHSNLSYKERLGLLRDVFMGVGLEPSWAPIQFAGPEDPATENRVSGAGICLWLLVQGRVSITTEPDSNAETEFFNLNAAIFNGYSIAWGDLEGRVAQCSNPNLGALVHRLERNPNYPIDKAVGWVAEESDPAWEWALEQAWIGQNFWMLCVEGQLPLATEPIAEPGAETSE